MRAPISDKRRSEQKSLGRSTCITWGGHITKHGYGRAFGNRKAMLAHRAAWIRVHGEIAPGHALMNVCGNKACVNVEVPGEHWSEVPLKEVATKGAYRSIARYGEQNHESKMSDAEVGRIRRKSRTISSSRKHAAFVRRVALDHGMHVESVRRILRGKSYQGGKNGDDRRVPGNDCEPGDGRSGEDRERG